MHGIVGQLSSRWMLAIYVVVAVVLPAPIWLFRDRPPYWSCGDEEPPGQDAALEAFRAGAIPLHAGAAVVLLAALLAWSERHGSDRTRQLTRVAVALAGAYLLIMLVWHEAFAPLAVAVFLGAALIGENALLVVVIASVLLVIVTARKSARKDDHSWLITALGWTLLLFGVPAHLAAVYLVGYGPIIC